MELLLALLRRARLHYDFTNHRNIIEREFDEDYRDPHFPSGWYMLPLVGLGALALLALFSL